MVPLPDPLVPTAIADAIPAVNQWARGMPQARKFNFLRHATSGHTREIVRHRDVHSFRTDLRAHPRGGAHRERCVPTLSVVVCADEYQRVMSPRNSTGYLASIDGA